MSEKATKYCSNCCQNIEANKFFLHERMCTLNVKKCPKCNKPFTIDDLEDHINDFHEEVECEFCNVKYPKIELEKHKKKCDYRMAQCIYCELEVLLKEIKEHQKSCGAITETCPNCGRYVQRKDLNDHLLEGCPPPKNDRRSVEVIHNSNSKLSLDMNKNNNKNINSFNPEDILKENIKGKVDIKYHNNIHKPNLPLRPASGKKVLNENIKKNMINVGKDTNNDINNYIINNKKDNKNNIKIEKTGGTKKYKGKTNDYINKHQNNNGPVTLKPIDNNNDNNRNIPNNSRYNNNDLNKNKHKGKKSTKPSFATNLSKGNLNMNSSRSSFRKTDEEFRKTKEKLNFKEAKKIEKNLNKKVEQLPKKNIKNSVINDEDYIANFNFGEVDDDQLLQQVIEQSLKDKVNK